jgi:TrpR-related protein YerC/YecD
MKYLDLFWTSIAGLQSRDEVKNFFKDLLSENEALMLARRIQIAKMLLEGKKYEEIVNKLHVGEDTVGKVQQWLTSGFGGYKKAVESFGRSLKQRTRTKEKSVLPYSFGWLKKKYPLHFLLFNFIDKVGGKENKK